MHALGLLLTAALGCTKPPESPHATTACHFEGVSEPVQCGTADVPFAVWRSLSARPLGDPLIVLTGRWGAEPLGAAVRFRSAFERVRRRRDVVFVGAPDTPNPTCEPSANAPVAARYSFLPSPECASALWASGARGGVTVENVESVRRKLNASRLNLWAEGVAARTAWAYATAFPGLVNTLVVDGVPPQASLAQTFVARAASVRDAMVERCAANASCASTYPDLRAGLAALLAYASRGIDVDGAHPVTGVRGREQLPPEAAFLALTALLELKQGPSVLPRAIHELKKGRLELLLGLAPTLRFGLPTDSAPAALLAEFCAGADVAASNALEVRRQRVCGPWKADVPQPGRRVGVPTLFLSAEFDPLFSRESAELALRNAPNGRHIHIAGATRRVSDLECGPLVLEAFIASADVQVKGLDCWQGLALDFEGALP
ncbi:MAG: hypothetical protein ACKVPX_02875 [Myxococcaceae bacterium]